MSTQQAYFMTTLRKYYQQDCAQDIPSVWVFSLSVRHVTPLKVEFCEGESIVDSPLYFSYLQ